jgi:hypothetical protein
VAFELIHRLGGVGIVVSLFLGGVSKDGLAVPGEFLSCRGVRVGQPLSPKVLIDLVTSIMKTLRW